MGAANSLSAWGGPGRGHLAQRQMRRSANFRGADAAWCGFAATTLTAGFAVFAAVPQCGSSEPSPQLRGR